ncbi:MAG: glycerol-3-phosphate dehydrogenase/oxidase [Deltaproteobacteria bacterium]|nr:glycerol-3-phosphate dehydrogenase/oxidase [Deltaproteobacteria bacterium]
MFSDFGLGADAGSESPFGALAVDRASTIRSIDKIGHADVVVIGGGIHGATFARIAALNGLKTVLLERADYASGTSSRSSKMAHGGLRYLEMLDFAQVYEGIKAREDLFVTAPHLVKPQEFLLPVYADSPPRWKLGFGLWLYDQMSRVPGRRQSWISARQLGPNHFSAGHSGFRGAFRYFDGLMRDTRIVIENIIAARQEGALCLNYAAVNSISSLNFGKVELGWTDTLTQTSHEITTGIVVNCAGPWVAQVGRITPSELASSIRFSQGSHLLFDKKWEGPALFLPLAEKNRYYWVWPHPAGTLVGTTEREVSALPDDPQPTANEIEEILARLERDVPHSGLSRSNLHYAFAGIRTLPLRKASAGSVAQLSRRHIWAYGSGTLHLLGGKFTTASWTALEGLRQVFKLAHLSHEPVSLKGRLLPGAALYAESVERFDREAQAAGVSESLRAGAIARMGALVRFLLADKSFLEPLGGRLLRGEVEFARHVEQAETLEDIMRRRVELEYAPDHGLSAVGEISRLLSVQLGAAKASEQEQRYRERLATLSQLLQGRGASLQSEESAVG